MFFSIVLVILGFLVLVYGGDRVCCGASAIAVRLRISQFIIGMTIVSISTSAPELITSLVAAWDNHQELVLSNIIGSNLANIGLAGGLVALIKPFDIPFRLPEISIFALISCVLSVVIITTKITAQEANFLFLLNFLYLL
jgi:cation:H+ antiporter